MALVDHEKIMDGLITYSRDILKGNLSEMPTAFGSMPSVIRDRIKAPRPDFPYIVVDRQNSLKEGEAWLRNVRTDTEDTLHFVSEQRVTVNVSCYGENADNILNKLRQSLLWDMNRFTLNERTSATFQFCSDVSEKPLFMETDFIDGAEMQIFFVALSDLEIENAVIDTVVVDGQYHGTPNPIYTEITISI